MDTQITQRYSKVDLFSVKGRMGRTYYLFYSIVIPFIFFWLFTTLSEAISVKSGLTSNPALLLGIATAVIFLILFYLTIQRCHDFDKSGWYALFVFIPFANLIYASVLSTNGLNRYGEVPEHASTFIAIVNYMLIGLSIALAMYLLYFHNLMT